MTLLLDAKTYHSLALELLLGEYTSTIFPPGYPAFIAMLGANPYCVVAVQVVLHILSIGLVWAITGRLFSRKAAWIASAVYSLDITSWFYVFQVLSETLFTFLLLAWFLLLARGSKPMAGIMLGLSIYVRPIAQFIPVVIAPLAWKTAIVALMVLAPWIGRNYVVHNSPFFTTHASYNLQSCNGPILRSYMDGSAVQGQTDEGYIFRHPIEYAVIHARGIVNTLILPNTRQICNFMGWQYKAYPEGYVATSTAVDKARAYLTKPIHEILIGLAIMIPTLTLLCLSIPGFIALYQIDRRIALVLLVSIASLVILPGPVGDGRFRVPIMPFVAILTAGAMKD